MAQQANPLDLDYTSNTMPTLKPLERRRPKGTTPPATSPGPPIRIILASPAGLALLGLQQLIAGIDDARVVATAGSPASLTRTLQQHPADVLILDQSLAEAANSSPGAAAIRILLLSPRIHPGTPANDIQACGFISERTSLEQARTALETVLTCTVLPWSDPKNCKPTCTTCPLRPSLSTAQELPLSQRELQIFGLIGSGLGTKTIATRLHRSIKTVEAHRENIKRKLGLHNATELADAAHRWSRGEAIEPDTPANSPPPHSS